MLRPASIRQLPLFPITGGVCVLALAVTLMWHLGGRDIGALVMTERAFVDQPWRLLTSVFPHGGMLHLIGNVYFLLILGDNCEDLLGPWKYLQLLVAATIVGGLAHIAVNLDSPIPCIGASGGISGVIAYYALCHPEAKVGLLLRFWWHFHWVYIPAGIAFLMWVLLQAGLSWGQVNGFTNVAAMAHLGGAAVGVGAWAAGRFVFTPLEEERVPRNE